MCQVVGRFGQASLFVESCRLNFLDSYPYQTLRKLEPVFWVFCLTIHPISPVILLECYCDVMIITTNQNKYGTSQDKVDELSNHESKVKIRRLLDRTQGSRTYRIRSKLFINWLIRRWRCLNSLCI